MPVILIAWDTREIRLDLDLHDRSSLHSDSFLISFCYDCIEKWKTTLKLENTWQRFYV